MSATNPLLDPAWVGAPGGPRSRRRRRLRVLALVIAVLLVVGVAATLVWRFRELTESRTASGLMVGECFELPEGESVVLVKIQDCSDRHDAEVYARRVLGMSEFPGDEVLERRAGAYCERTLVSELGDAGVGDLEVWHAVPTVRSWAQGDLSITCAVYDPARPMVGSLTDAGGRALEQNKNVF